MYIVCVRLSEHRLRDFFPLTRKKIEAICQLRGKQYGRRIKIYFGTDLTWIEKKNHINIDNSLFAFAKSKYIKMVTTLKCNKFSFQFDRFISCLSQQKIHRFRNPSITLKFKPILNTSGYYLFQCLFRSIYKRFSILQR